MRTICLAVSMAALISVAPAGMAASTHPLQVAQASDDGQAAFIAAGKDLTKLKAVAAEHPNTPWGKLAAALAKTLESQQGAAPDAASRQIKVEPKVAAPVVEAPPPEPQVPAVEPPATTVATYKIMPDGSGDYRTIADALAAVEAGSRIEVYPGTHTGGVIVDKPVDIVGIGSFEQIIWEASGTDLMQWKAASGSVSNMTLLQKGGCEKTCNVIYFNGGSATVEGNGMTSEGGATLYVQGAAARPRIYKNNVHNAKEAGIFIEAFAGGEIEANDIAGNGFAGIEIKGSAHPLVRANTVRDGKQGGIYANTDARGLILNNDVYGNAFAGIEIKDGADPVVRDNRVFDQKENGIFVNAKGRGLIVGNDVYGNGRANFAITASSPAIISNTIRDGKEGGVLYEAAAGGLFESNLVKGNALAGVEIKADANPTLRKNIIRDGKQSGVFVHERGRGILEDNDINANGFSGIEVIKRGDPTVNNNRITGNKDYALTIYDQGRGTFTDNDLGNNGRGSSKVDKTAGKVKRSGNRE